MDKFLFMEACDKIIDVQRERLGIGTLGEKTIHAVLKEYYEPHEANHEVKLGNYVADILGEDGVIEIQTANFSSMRKKLTAFLEFTTVTVVYPIAKTKWLCWVENDTGAVSKRRKSPQKGNIYSILYEMYWIKDLLLNKNLRFIITMLEVEEYRKLDGWGNDKKHGATKIDKIPIDILEEIQLRCFDDYRQLLPTNLPQKFTAKELIRITKGSSRKTYASIKVLCELGIFKEAGKSGKATQWEIA